MTQDRIIIAGGGIGGLATAIGLAQKGIRSLVLEKAPELGEIGAGIQLGPNAFHASDYLGVGDAARKAEEMANAKSHSLLYFAIGGSAWIPGPERPDSRAVRSPADEWLHNPLSHRKYQ